MPTLGNRTIQVAVNNIFFVEFPLLSYQGMDGTTHTLLRFHSSETLLGPLLGLTTITHIQRPYPLAPCAVDSILCRVHFFLSLEKCRVVARQQ
jgi:hypothetical protein